MGLLWLWGPFFNLMRDKLNCMHVMLEDDGLVTTLNISVFCFRPKWASNWVVLVVLLCFSLIFSIIFLTISAKSASDYSGSESITKSILFMIWFLHLTIPAALWSPVGARISFIFLLLQYISNAGALNAFARSHLKINGIPWNSQ